MNSLAQLLSAAMCDSCGAAFAETVNRFRQLSDQTNQVADGVSLGVARGTDGGRGGLDAAQPLGCGGRECSIQALADTFYTFRQIGHDGIVGPGSPDRISDGAA